MIEHLETRELLSGAAVDPTTSARDLGVIQLNDATGEWQASRFNGTDFVAETITTWNTVPQETVVVHGDLWGTGQDELVRFDRETGNFIAEWKSGSGIATGVVTSWIPNMDLQFLTIQDLNHDGRDDIIAQDRTTGRWAVSTSVGAGGYSARFIGTWQTGINWQHLTIADVNGDGLDDVLAINPNSDQWNLLIGTTGNFNSLTVGNAFPTTRIAQLETGNYDGNAGVDILQRDAVTGTWLKSSLIGNGFYSQNIGSWSPTTTWVDVNTLDFWGSGRDVIVGRDTTTNTWQALWSSGSGIASSNLGAWAPGNYADIQTGDFNGDGRDDLVARQTATGRWYQLASTGTAVQTRLLGTWPTGISIDNVQAADFNQDGKTDLIGRNSTTGNWLGLISNANGFTATTLSSPSYGYSPTDVMVGDFDADGKPEVFSRDAGTSNRWQIEADGTQLTGTRFNTWTAYGTGWSDRQVIDLNGDGDNDLLARDASTGDWWLTTLQGTAPTTSRIGNWASSTQWQSWLILDIDGNGTKDVVARNQSTGDWHLLRMVNGVATSTVMVNWSKNTTWTDLQVADLFGNGREVILARDSATNLWHGIWNSGGGFATSSLLGLVAGRSYVDTRVVDFFGDGRQTVVTRDATSGTWHGLWYGNNQFYLTNLGTWNSGNWDSVSVASLEDNGREAVYGHDLLSGQWRRIAFDGTNVSNTVVATGLPYSAVQLTSVGNFVDSGRDSILARASTTGNWTRLSYNGTGYVLANLGVWADTATWTTTTVADYNRDGRADLFGYSSNLGTWRIRSFDGTNWFGVAAGNLSPSARILDVPGASNAALRSLILADLPGLKSALNSGDTRTAVHLLRQWTANAADAALFSNPLLIDAMSAADAYFQDYVANRAGSSCGGFSDFYTQILSLFQIDSLTINMGDVTADLIHTTVLVPIWENNAWSYEFYDPTFNGTLINTSTNAPLSYLDIVSAVQAGNTSNIGVEESSNDNREFLSAVQIDNVPQITFESIENGVYIYRWTDYGLDDYLKTYEPTFQAYGYPTGLQGFLRLTPKVLSVYANNGSGNPQTSADMKSAFLAGLQARGITVTP